MGLAASIMEIPRWTVFDDGAKAFLEDGSFFDSDQWMDLWIGGVQAVVEMTLDKTWMGTTYDTMAAIFEPERKLSRAATRFLGSFIPGAVSQFQTRGDPLIRGSHEALDNIWKLLPFVSENVTARVNELGRVKTQSGGWFTRMFAAAPATPQAAEEDQIIGNALANANIAIGAPPTKIQVGRDEIELTPLQRQVWMLTAGPFRRRHLLSVIRSGTFKRGDQFIKREMIEAVNKEAMAAGRAAVLTLSKGAMEDRRTRAESEARDAR